MNKVLLQLKQSFVPRSWDRFPDNAYIDKMHCKSLCIKASAIVNIIYNANLQLFPCDIVH